MNTIKRDVYVLRDTIKIPIEVTKGTDMVGSEFAVRDYSIPGTAAAVAYVYHKSMEKPKGILCDINDSTISFTPDNNFFAVGMNELQIRVINNGKSLISFKEKIKCSDAMGFPDDEEESQQTLVEQLLTKVGKEEGDRKTADETEREERIAADAEEKKARAEADETIRANRIVALDEIDLVTEEGFFVDALAVKELNSKTQKFPNYSSLDRILTSSNNIEESYTFQSDGWFIAYARTQSESSQPFIRIAVGNNQIFEGHAERGRYRYLWSPPFPVKAGTKVNFTIKTDVVASDNQFGVCFIRS